MAKKTKEVVIPYQINHPKPKITWFIKIGINPYLKLFPVVPYFYEVPCFKMFKKL